MSAKSPDPTDCTEAAARGPDGGTQGLHLLQSLLAPAPGLPPGLFLRITPETDVAPPPDGPIRLPQHAVLSTNTFFGSFYRAYWQSVGAGEGLVVALDIDGVAKVRIMEETGQAAECICEALIEGTGRLCPRPAQGSKSRLFVEVEAMSTCTVARIDWMSARPPRRRTTLSVGLCTFNQEAYLAETLEKLITLAQALPVIRRIHVVNQGAPFASETLRALCHDPLVRLIEQRNLGGCGGFARSLAEELAQPDPASHHLLMDDDIVLDARMIARALRFLDHAQDEVALGAGMFDSLRPAVMYEAGAWVSETNRIEPCCRNVDLSDPAELSCFNARVETDYNAWWFCILPLATVRRVGMPTPVFIRGDDFDYGLRMLQQGTATVTLPGIGVWHEPFYAKPPGWQDYYDLRNRLIVGASFGDRVHQLSLAHVTGMVTTALLTHNYASARLRLLALADFLKGPSLLEEDAAAIHRRVLDVARTATAKRLGPEWAERPVVPRGIPRPDRMGALVRQQALALARNLLWPFRDKEVLLLDEDAQPGAVAGTSYVMTNKQRSFHLRFAPKRGELWRLLRQTLGMARRYRAEVARTSAAWGRAIGRFRQPDFWHKLFTSDTGA